MGEVWKARDSRLRREVAIKLLPEALARDAEHLARFDREAQALAALNHANIATIYGLEEAEAKRFLVLELVGGETLAEQLAAGPLALLEALHIARQIASALEAAHEKGIVHRDLKPANIKVTPDGKVKVLDFGLAKSLALAASGTDTDLRTATSSGTREGTILGTPAYMSPEQARGKPVDKRTDIWSFGCVLYEMLTGCRAFSGETVSDTLAAILDREPDWGKLPRGTPAQVRNLLKRCLEKDVGRRTRDAGDARLEIEAATPAQRGRPAASARKNTALLLAVVAVAVLAAALLLARWRATQAGSAHPLPTLAQLTSAEGIEESPAWSPDEGQIVYVAESGGVRKIFLRRLASGEEKRVTTGDFDDIQPNWSPDGKTFLFVRAREPGKKLQPGDVFGQYIDGDVWERDVGSGRETKLVENAFNPVLSPDGRRIAVDASWVGPRRIWVVDRQGLNPQQVTSDVSEAVDHVRPRWSPDGTRIVFQNIERTRFDIRVADMATKKLIWVTNDLPRDVDPVWSPSGKDIYFSSDRGGGLNIWRIPVRPDGSPAGVPQQLTTGAGQDVEIALSRDGRKAAFSILKQNADIWKLPVSPESGRPTGPPEPVVATTREDSRGAWSPDGRSIAFNSDRVGGMNIWIYSFQDGSTRQLTKGPGGDYQPNWSPDGKRIAFFSSRAGNLDIWSVEVDSGELKRLTHSSSIDVNPFFSPDSRQIAYQSDQSGRLEVWLMNADGSSPRQLTRVGVSGHFLRWTRDGGFVVFRCPCGGKPQTLQIPPGGGDPKPLAEIAGGAHMSFSPDASLIMDVLAHKALWISPLKSGKPEKVFDFEDPDSRIDYPVWSPDGRYVLFDRFRPQGGDIWLMEKFE